jgi:crotonobetainyl-CoA:carnitine CoA-transferase CaiB-like acyl-CoA transferase
MIGDSALMDDPRFTDDLRRGENGAALSEMMSAWCASRTREEALAALEAARIPAGPVYSPREALDDPAIQASHAFDWVDYPGLARKAPIVVSPAMLSRTPPSIESRPPTIGEHTTEILHEAGYGDAQIQALRELGVA